jgi:2-polyprenyl-3-methyl-5-hydroxy-6-metoxy-1,4-benzoquinol methylase
MSEILFRLARSLTIEMKRDWAQVIFVDHPQVFLPWMKAMREQAEVDVRGLQIVLKKFGVHSGARILDLPSGIGRISINLAKAGYNVVGVDISPLYLDFARKWAEQDQVEDRTRFYQMDMRDATRGLKRKGEEKFDVILNYGTAIGYRGEEEDARMITDLPSIASPHALLVIETVNRDYLVKHFEQESSSRLEGVEWRESRRLNLEKSFMENIWRFYRRSRQSRSLILRVPVSHRVYSLHELKQLMSNAGWKYLKSYGSLRKLSSVTTDSSRMIVIGRKYH